MRTASGFPPLLRKSARPRWSHRDPVEGGNPFPTNYPQYASWEEATRIAQLALRRHDAHLYQTVATLLDPEHYRAQLLDLAVSRFDTWARRGRSVISDNDTWRDYTAWLHNYADNWLKYVAETCPHTDVGDELRERLTARSTHWVADSHSKHVNT